MSDELNPRDFMGVMTERFASGTIADAVKTAEEKINAVTRLAAEIHSYSELTAKLAGTKQLNIKLGMDPTAPDITLGHAVPLQLARHFQEWGHKVVIIIGDYTASVGDPSGVDKTRPMLDAETIRRNAYTYLDQVGRILHTDVERFVVQYNSQWLNNVSIVKLSSSKTVQQMLSRASFAERFAKGQEIRLHELLYPLFQGWDSVMVDADVELGGTDQLFNMMVGRELQVREGKPPQVVICTPLLVGLDGVQKMSKSKGNYIGLTDEPNTIFGKVMSLPDAAMPQYFWLLTGYTPEQWHRDNPRDSKALLARTLVEKLHCAGAAAAAQKHFDAIFQNGEIPDEMPEVSVVPAPFDFDLLGLVATHFQMSKTQARQKIAEGAIRVNGQRVTNPDQKFVFDAPAVLQFGKRNFVRLVPS
jgi:tyrosyl-tRNA synthetase